MEDKDVRKFFKDITIINLVGALAFIALMALIAIYRGVF